MTEWKVSVVGGCSCDWIQLGKSSWGSWRSSVCWRRLARMAFKYQTSLWGLVGCSRLKTPLEVLSDWRKELVSSERCGFEGNWGPSVGSGSIHCHYTREQSDLQRSEFMVKSARITTSSIRKVPVLDMLMLWMMPHFTVADTLFSVLLMDPNEGRAIILLLCVSLIIAACRLFILTSHYIFHYFFCRMFRHICVMWLSEKLHVCLWVDSNIPRETLGF